MPLVKTMDILDSCARGGYAVGAFNLNGLDQPRFLIQEAERLKSPILLVEPGVIEKYMSFEDFAMVSAFAAKSASVPVGIHLSHGLDLEQFERACKAGFTSAMYDGSKLPYEENVYNTKLAVEIGRKYGCAVEGELGALGSSFTNAAESMTDPALAKDFVARTGVDILAVAVGNAHGFYKGTPSLDFKRLEEIRYAIMPYNCYLTLHGGTGIPENHIKRSIQMGIVKICIYTEMCHEGKKDIKAYVDANPDYAGNYDIPEMLRAMMGGFTRSMKSCMDMFMSIGRADASLAAQNPQISTPKAERLAVGAVSAASAEIPQNTEIGPEYPSLPALNPNFQGNGKFWDIKA